MMRIDVHHFFHPPETDAKLDTILAKLFQIQQKEDAMSTQLDVLQAQVEKNTTIEESAVVLINGLAAQITALKNDPAALQALADSLNASSTDLSNAIQANTPAPPTP
jgi:chromosome segregation ATPase